MRGRVSAGRCRRDARRAVLIAVLVAALAGCGADGVPRYSDFGDLSAAAAQRMRTDNTFVTSYTSSITLSGQVVARQEGEGTFLRGPDGVSATLVFRVEGRAPRPYSNELIVLPDRVYRMSADDIRAPGAPPYTEFDLDSTEPPDLYYAQVVRQLRLTGTGPVCFSTLGRTEIVRSTPGIRDGVPVTTYVLGIDLTRGSVAILGTEAYRSLGFDRIESVVEMDAQDRVLRCSVDAVLPGTDSRVLAEERFMRFGEPVTITAPPPEQIMTTTPPIDGPPG